MISTITIAFTMVAAPQILASALATAMAAVSLPTGPTGDLTQLTGATLANDTTTAAAAPNVTRTLQFQFPTTVLALAIPATGPVATVVPAAIAAGSQTVIPQSMANIQVGSILAVDTQNPLVEETVQVTAITATTFTAMFANAHGIGSAVAGNGTIAVTPLSMVNIYGPVQTTATTAVAAPGAVVVTPKSMQNVVVGVPLVVDGGTALQETVTVTSVTATTFTATYANAHAAGFSIVQSGSTLQVGFDPYTTTATQAVPVGTSTFGVTASGPITAGMALVVDAGTANQETVIVQDATTTTLTAKFANAHTTGFAITTVASPGTMPENVVVQTVTATQFTAVFSAPHAAFQNVGGIVNAQFPGPNSPVGQAFAALYQPLLANALRGPVTASAPVVIVV